LVAEAHCRVWRRLAAGEPVDDIPAHLIAAVRGLGAQTGGGVDDTGACDRDAGPDPRQTVAYVDLIVPALSSLPQRWVKALWLAEVEQLRPAAVGRRLGTGRAVATALLSRAREELRRAFLRALPGAPWDPTCTGHWEKMATWLRGRRVVP